MKDYQNILIIKMSSLGDIIHALPTLYALRQNLPHAKITWAVHPQFAHILPGKPWIDEVILVEKKGLKSLSYIRKLWNFSLCRTHQALFGPRAMGSSYGFSR